MHLTVVSGLRWRPGLRVVEEITNLGHSALHIPHSALITSHTPQLDVQLDNVSFKTDAITHTANHEHLTSLYAIDTLEKIRAIPYLNSLNSVLLADDKFLTSLILAEAGLPTPNTVLVPNQHAALQICDSIGFPLVIKTPRGDSGSGVRLIHSQKELTELDPTWWTANGLLLQHFIAESAGHDIRVVVIDNQIITAVDRQGPPGDFRANLANGGNARAHQLTDAEAELALAATAALNLDICGVDLLTTSSGPVVVELNAAPGFADTELASSTNIARPIANLLIKRASQ